MKTKISIIAGFLVGAVLLFFAFRSVDFASLPAIYSRVNVLFLIPFVFTIFLELVLRAARWRLLLNPSKPVRLWDAFRLETSGLALSNILPLRLGEIARGTFGAKIFDIPVLTVFATILVERALDIIVLFIMFAAAARFGGITGGLMNYGKWLWVMLAGLLAAMSALVFADELVAHRWFYGFFGRFPWIRRLFERVAMGVKGFHSFRSGALILVLAFLQWFLDALNCYWMGRAFGLGGVLDIFKSIALLFTGAAAASMPGMPGYFGNFEFTMVKVMLTWGIQKDVGFAYASCVHMLGYIIVTLLGVFFVYQMGHSLGKVWGEFSGKEANQIQDSRFKI
ncbi:MAG: lysylphosphatidylglycerol synthase transmembrane domain-containing protein [Elusimicrobia bacterium]|nr:lysylphosphatidylglycerol synthase transmembrane domain-containing protein [Elusimicrobiota bacterium]